MLTIPLDSSSSAIFDDASADIYMPCFHLFFFGLGARFDIIKSFQIESENEEYRYIWDGP